jgi:hypothetical protein
MIAKLLVTKKRISEIRAIPCLIGGNGGSQAQKRDENGERILEYLQKITEEGSLNGRYGWDGDEMR